MIGDATLISGAVLNLVSNAIKYGKPGTEIEVRWRFPDGRSLAVPRITTDANGHFSIELDAKAIAASKENVASSIEVDTRIPVGPYKPSQALKDVVQAMFVTIFMALLSTSIATVVAAPLVVSGGEAVRLVLGTIPMLIVAGVLEAFVSPTGIPVALKFTVAVVMFATHYSQEMAFAQLVLHARPAWLLVALLLQMGTYVTEARIWQRVLCRAKISKPLRSYVGLALAKLFMDQAIPSVGLSGTLLVIQALDRRGVPRADLLTFEEIERL